MYSWRTLILYSRLVPKKKNAANTLAKDFLSDKYPLSKKFTLKDILLRCELNFTDVAAVLVIDVSSVFFVATAVKIDVTAEILMRQQ